MAQPSSPAPADVRKDRRVQIALLLISIAALVAGGAFLRNFLKERKFEQREAVRQVVEAPQIAQERAVAEARAALNIELLPDDGTFIPATGDIEVGSLLYTIHHLGPAKVKYYSEDAVLAGRQGDLFIVRPILGKQRAPGAPAQNYRSRQSRSAERKREEVKAQKKITLAELSEKYAARTGQ